MIIRAQRQAHFSFHHPYPAGRRLRLRMWAARHRVLVIASCAGTLVAGSGLVHAHASTIRNAPMPRAQNGPAFLSVGPFPAGLALRGRATWSTDLQRLDAGMRASISADLRDGFRVGALQQFAHGPRQLRLVLRTYASAAGASAAYSRQARYLAASLPDPSLRTTVTEVRDAMGPALRAVYVSGSGTRSYTVTTLLFRRAALVGQVDAFPSGTDDGHPVADVADESAIRAGVLAASHS